MFNGFEDQKGAISDIKFQIGLEENSGIQSNFLNQKERRLARRLCETGRGFRGARSQLDAFEDDGHPAVRAAQRAIPRVA